MFSIPHTRLFGVAELGQRGTSSPAPKPIALRIFAPFTALIEPLSKTIQLPHPAAAPRKFQALLWAPSHLPERLEVMWLGCGFGGWARKSCRGLGAPLGGGELGQ